MGANDDAKGGSADRISLKIRQRILREDVKIGRSYKPQREPTPWFAVHKEGKKDKN